MKLKKSPPALIEFFDTVVPGPPAERRKMFGFPCSFVNGNMYMGLYQDDMALRLPDEHREKFLRIRGARIFEPMPGRPMREYIVVPKTVMEDRKELAQWIDRSLKYAASIKPKVKKSRVKAGVSKSKGSVKKSAGKSVGAAKRKRK